MVAKYRDIHSDLLGGIHNQRAGQHPDFFPINHEIYQLIHFRSINLDK
jgi:hypothetical protein